MSHIMTVDETARLLRIHPETLRERARQGKIPATKLGRQWRFVREQLDAWLDQGADLPTSSEDWALIAIAEERMAQPGRRLRPFAEFLAELEQ